MKNYVVLFSSHKEWGKQIVEACTPIEALQEVHGDPLPGVEVEKVEDGLYRFSWEKSDSNYEESDEYFVGTLIEKESLKEGFYAFRHDYEDLRHYSNPVECLQDIVKDLGEAYGLEEAEEVTNFLAKGSEDTLNVPLENWGDTTIFYVE